VVRGYKYSEVDTEAYRRRLVHKRVRTSGCLLHPCTGAGIRGGFDKPTGPSRDYGSPCEGSYPWSGGSSAQTRCWRQKRFVGSIAQEYVPLVHGHIEHVHVDMNDLASGHLPIILLRGGPRFPARCGPKKLMNYKHQQIAFGHSAIPAKTLFRFQR